jgi:hypothetical protein
VAVVTDIKKLTALPKATVLAYGQTGSGMREQGKDLCKLLEMIIKLGSLQAVGNDYQTNILQFYFSFSTCRILRTFNKNPDIPSK